jgi:hypothetical protein
MKLKNTIILSALGILAIFGFIQHAASPHANVAAVQTAHEAATPIVTTTPTPTVPPPITPTPTAFSEPTQATMQSGDASVPVGATAKCADGTYSFSQHRSGTCSHHGGVVQWY